MDSAVDTTNEMELESSICNEMGPDEGGIDSDGDTKMSGTDY